MRNQEERATQQINYLVYELRMLVSGKLWRWLTIWFGSSAGVIVSYRLDRFLYLLLGQSWGLIRIIFFPIFLLLRVISYSHEIHYKAEIKKGLLILHPSLGVVVSGHAIVGEHLTLTGGNCIGGKETLSRGDLLIGNNVSLGANAVILGPLTLGSDITIGAGSVVIDSFDGGQVVAGVPGKTLQSK